MRLQALHAYGYAYVTIDSMDVLNLVNTLDVLQLLRQRLYPASMAESLIDAIEGVQEEARKSAVLLPLFVQDGVLHLTLIRRASTLRAHGGEIAFPGGQVEPSDTSLLMTAVRETHEEIGLDPTRIEILGVLPPVFTVVSNYLITPVVAFLPQGPGTLKLQESEVAELLIIPLPKLADPAIAYTEQWTRNSRTRTIHFYDYNSQRIWGATGRILMMLLELLKPQDSVPDSAST
jgi:8-oxo-dGTP pyrophosphatase MutT (NUDIX family)